MKVLRLSGHLVIQNNLRVRGYT
uniref:Uncharacterized protein n=1 Tax=Arundo donax TaxID=35708 RepID=A0A0A8Z067_ARUDO